MHPYDVTVLVVNFAALIVCIINTVEFERAARKGGGTISKDRATLWMLLNVLIIIGLLIVLMWSLKEIL